MSFCQIQKVELTTMNFAKQNLKADLDELDIKYERTIDRDYLIELDDFNLLQLALAHKYQFECYDRHSFNYDVTAYIFYYSVYLKG